MFHVEQWIPRPNVVLYISRGDISRIEVAKQSGFLGFGLPLRNGTIHQYAPRRRKGEGDGSVPQPQGLVPQDAILLRIHLVSHDKEEGKLFKSWSSPWFHE